MAAFKNGNWSNEPIATFTTFGEFNRQQSQLRDYISPEDAAPDCSGN